MKKFIYILLAICCLFLVGCSNNNNNDNKDDKNKEIEYTIIDKELTFVVGEEIDFALEGDYVLDTTDSSGLSIASNKITAKEVGNWKFVYTTGTNKYQYSVAVINETFKLKKDEFVLLQNATGLIEYTSNTKSNVTFESLNNNVATVDENGVIKGLAIGTCSIKVSTPYNNATVEVEVLDTKNTCTIVDDKIDMEVGKTQYLLLDSSNTKNEGVTFTAKQGVLEISKHGIITPVKSGTEVITIKDAKGATKQMTVNVIDKFEKIDFKDESKVNVFGRTKVSDNNELTVYHSASGFECVFEGTSFKATIFSDCTLSPYAYIKVYLDDTEYSIGLDKGSKAEYTLAENLEDKVHTIKVLKRTEESTGKLIFSDLKADLFITPPAKKTLKLEVYGDSYTAGYGVLGKSTDPHNATIEDGTLSYAYVASQKLDAQINVYCYSGISIGIKGWIKDFFLPDLAPYYSSHDKTEWDFNNYQADIIIVYLGTNDNYGLSQKFGTATEFTQRYKAFINFLLEKTPNAKIVCCYGFSAMDSSLETAIKNMPKYFRNQAFTFKLPAASLTGANGHPNAASQVKGGEKLAEYITSTILPLLNETED